MSTILHIRCKCKWNLVWKYFGGREKLRKITNVAELDILGIHRKAAILLYFLYVSIGHFIKLVFLDVNTVIFGMPLVSGLKKCYTISLSGNVSVPSHILRKHHEIKGHRSNVERTNITDPDAVNVVNVVNRCSAGSQSSCVGLRRSAGRVRELREVWPPLAVERLHAVIWSKHTNIQNTLLWPERKPAATTCMQS